MRRSSGSKTRVSFKNVGNIVMRLLAIMKTPAEIPFSQVLGPKAEEKTAKVVRALFLIFSLDKYYSLCLIGEKIIETLRRLTVSKVSTIQYGLHTDSRHLQTRECCVWLTCFSHRAKWQISF